MTGSRRADCGPLPLMRVGSPPQATRRCPGGAVFYILVADVETTCADAEQLGGSVISKNLDPEPGAPTFAYLRARANLY